MVNPPNFGVDQDILDTQKAIADQEKLLGHEWKPVQDDNGYWNVPEAAAADSYTYRDTGAWYSLLQLGEHSDPICPSSGCAEQKSKVKAKDDYPKNYFVPNFGQEHEINHNFESLDWAQKSLNHTWVVPPKEKAKAPILYHDSKPLDPEIQTSLHNLKEQENEHGTWELPQEGSLLSIGEKIHEMKVAHDYIGDEPQLVSWDSDAEPLTRGEEARAVENAVVDRIAKRLNPHSGDSDHSAVKAALRGEHMTTEDYFTTQGSLSDSPIL